MKKFQWQAKNEKVLYFSRQEWIHYILINFLNILIILWISFFISFVVYIFTENFNISLMLFVILLILAFSYMYLLWKKTYVIITNKRILKFVRSWLFSEHMKELKLDQLNEVSARKQWFIEKIFRTWNIKITGKDKENVIWFQWVLYPKEIVLYISRLRDYIIENPDYKVEDIKEFIPRKERKVS